MDVKNLIENYDFDRVIVVAGEESVNAVILDLFGDLGVSMQLKEEEETGNKPSAFDSTNHGFYLGQGAAIAVFERADVCKTEPLAKLVGAYSASENYANALGQRDDGDGFVKAIEGVLRVAKVDRSEVNLVKTHGTGTPVNNAAEKTALQKCLPEFIATSYKPRIGHTVGVSGLLETGLLLDALNEGYVPEIPNRTETDSVFLSARAPAPDGMFLSLAAGMGNIYSAALFSREV
jgi:3-oxoacyl-(acyl-carrier-protein) synthase